ncbi:peptide chain release factor [Gammaproteobacteria bacterium]
MNNQLHSCWLQVTAGQGPDECALATAKVAAYLTKEAKQFGLKTELLEIKSGNKVGTYLSALVSLQGDGLDLFIKRWQGTIQWISTSPYRPYHKRKNWFIGIDVFKTLENHTKFNKQDLRFETMRATGPGGQHVNTTDSAVRVIHVPTGLTAVAREERSQHMNKKLALAKLVAIFVNQHDTKQTEIIKEQWAKHQQLERGNPTRVFVDPAFIEKEVR